MEAICEHLDRLTVEYMTLHDNLDAQMAALEEVQRAVSFGASRRVDF